MFRDEQICLETLNEDVMLLILCKLNLHDVLNMSLVCKIFANLAQWSNLWNNMLQADFGIAAKNTRQDNEAFFDIYKREYTKSYKKIILILSQDRKQITLKLDNINLSPDDTKTTLMMSPNDPLMLTSAYTVFKSSIIDPTRDKIHPLLLRAKECHDYDSVLSFLTAIKSHPNCRLYILHFFHAHIEYLIFPKGVAVDCSKEVTLDDMINAVTHSKNKAIEAGNHALKRCSIA